MAEGAITRYLEYEEWPMQEIRRDLTDVDAGRVVPQKEVEVWLDSWGTNHKLPLPERK